MTLPASAYRNPAEVADENMQKEKRDAEFKIKQAERHRIYQSMKHKMQVKKLLKEGGMR
mgnify:CR=1 FL=1